MRVHSLFCALALAAGAAALPPAAQATESDGWSRYATAFGPLLLADSRSRSRDARPAPSDKSVEEDGRQPLPYGSGYEKRKTRESDRGSGGDGRGERSDSERRRR